MQEGFGSPSQMKHSGTPVVTEQLWVDKYAPNSFTELLSDEQTNREVQVFFILLPLELLCFRRYVWGPLISIYCLRQVLLWLKQWDSCVFGSQIRATTDDVFSALRRHSSAQHQKLSDNRSFFTKNHTSGYFNQNIKHPNVIDRENINLNDVLELRSKQHTVNCHPEQKVRGKEYIYLLTCS